MKHLKPYNKLQLKNKPEIGDYVFINPIGQHSEIIKIALKNVGQITNKFTSESKKHNSFICYRVIYKNNNQDIDYLETWVNEEDIIDWSKNKEDLDYLIAASKYNL